MLKGLEQGNHVLKEIHQEMSVEAVQKLMEDTAEAIAYQNVRSQCSSPPYAGYANEAAVGEAIWLTGQCLFI